MKFIKNLRGSRALVAVAHPDDETIWLGGFISRHRKINWTIFSLCRASDPDRRPKFLRVCRHYGARAIITNLPDDGRLTEQQLIPLIKEIVTAQFGQPLAEPFDYIFSHGQSGEYGHPTHRAVYRAIKSLIKEHKLKTKTWLCFNCAPSWQPTAKADSDLIIRLTAKEFKDKKAVMTELYGFSPAGVDANYCTNPEAFKIMKMNLHG